MHLRLCRERLGDEQRVQHRLHAPRARGELVAQLRRHALQRRVEIGARELHPAVLRQHVGRQLGVQRRAKQRCRERRTKRKQDSMSHARV